MINKFKRVVKELVGKPESIPTKSLPKLDHRSNDNEIVVVGLSSIPGREKFVSQTIDSLLNQTMKPAKIVLSICKNYRRFPDQQYDTSFVQHLETEDLFVIKWMDHDFGPSTKYMGALHVAREMKAHTAVVVDDDLYYNPKMIENLYTYYKNHKPGAFTHWAFSIGKITFGQGADAVMFSVSDLKDFDSFYSFMLEQDPMFFFQDDILLGCYLYYKSLPMYRCPLFDDLNAIYTPLDTENINALKNEEGTTQRELLNLNLYKSFLEILRTNEKLI